MNLEPPFMTTFSRSIRRIAPPFEEEEFMNVLPDRANELFLFLFDRLSCIMIAPPPFVDSPCRFWNKEFDMLICLISYSDIALSTLDYG